MLLYNLIGKKHTTHQAHIHDPQSTTKKEALRGIHSNVQIKLHEMEDSWLSARANDIHGYADKNEGTSGGVMVSKLD